MDNDFIEIRHFLAVVRTGSLSGAAKLLQVTQPTVGRYIASMERRLNRQLFQRHPEGMALTEAGHQLVPHAREVEAMIEAFSRRVAETSSPMSGSVRLSATEGVGTLWLMPRLTGVLRAHPYLTIELVIDNAAVDLARRESDIALRLTQPAAENIASYRVGTLALQLMAAESYVAEFGAPATVEEFHRHKVISPHIRRAPPDTYWQRILHHGAHVALASNSSIAQVKAVVQGLGISILPSYVGRLYPGLVPIMPDWRWQPREIYLAAHTELVRTPRIRGVMDVISDIFNRDGPDLKALYDVTQTPQAAPLPR